MKELPVDKDTRVTLHFALKFESGEVIDSTFDKDRGVLWKSEMKICLRILKPT